MLPLQGIPDEALAKLREQILADSTPLPQKYECLFTIRSVANEKATDILIECLEDESTLFRHDVAFCLGQRQDPKAVDALIDIVKSNEDSLVRHEAAEALGAIGTETCLPTLKAHLADPSQEVAETCQLAMQRIEYFGSCTEQLQESQFNAVDPTPPFPPDVPTAELGGVLMDESKPMFDRYRAMFSLRNLANDEAVRLLCDAFESSSALLKHELAYVLGQLQSELAGETLCKVLADTREHPMVRHEAADALGSLGKEGYFAILREHVKDGNKIVADTCTVAVDKLQSVVEGIVQFLPTAA